MAMPSFHPRAIALATLCGACAAPVWIDALGWCSARVWLPAMRWLIDRGARDQTLLLVLYKVFETAVSALLALAIATPLAYFSGQRVRPLWIAFAAGLAAYLAADWLVASRRLFPPWFFLLQPMTYAMLLAPGLGLWLGARLRRGVD